MLGTHDLALFVASGWLLNITPGADTLYIATRSVTQGLKAGIVAALGISCGCCLHVAAAAVGLICLLEAVRRTIGLPLLVVAVAFIAYAFAGPWMPAVISHPGASLGRMTDHMWLSGEGVFGLTLGVSCNLVFLFVLYSALLDKAGAGNWFITSSMALR